MTDTFPTIASIVLATITMFFAIGWTVLLPYTYENTVCFYLLMLIGFLSVTNDTLVGITFAVTVSVMVYDGIRNMEWKSVMKESMNECREMFNVFGQGEKQ